MGKLSGVPKGTHLSLDEAQHEGLQPCAVCRLPDPIPLSCTIHEPGNTLRLFYQLLFFSEAQSWKLFHSTSFNLLWQLFFCLKTKGLWQWDKAPLNKCLLQLWSSARWLIQQCSASFLQGCSLIMWIFVIHNLLLVALIISWRRQHNVS